MCIIGGTCFSIRGFGFMSLYGGQNDNGLGWNGESLEPSLFIGIM